MLHDLIAPPCTKEKLGQLTRMVTRHYEHHLRVTGIRNTQLTLLSHVVLLGPIRPGDLAKRAEGQHQWKQAQRALNAKLGTQYLAQLHALLDSCTQRLQDVDGH